MKLTSHNSSEGDIGFRLSNYRQVMPSFEISRYWEESFPLTFMWMFSIESYRFYRLKPDVTRDIV